MGIYNGFERGSTNQNQAPELTVFIKSVLQPFEFRSPRALRCIIF